MREMRKKNSHKQNNETKYNERNIELVLDMTIQKLELVPTFCTFQATATDS